MQAKELKIDAGIGGPLDALWLQPQNAHAVYVFAHGAGASMKHHFMEDLSGQLAQHGVATLRYQFPYMQHGGKRPDPPPVLEAAVRAAIDKGHELAGRATLIAGGKSMGGRMTSQALAKQHDERVAGIAFVGFPLHQPNKPGRNRAEHLNAVQMPMLFIQGTRDTLADLALMQQVHGELRDDAMLHIIEGADHSFSVLKRTGRTNEDVLQEIAAVISAWSARL